VIEAKKDFTKRAVYNFNALSKQALTIELLNGKIVSGNVKYAFMNLISIIEDFDEGFVSGIREVLIPVSSIAMIVPHKGVK
jgi:phosphotransferase system  glucose/maltose/N-acetylglucosamine-specific IIC component